ncbi:MAG: hypothetical protein ACJ73S_29775 [Mycobacteriales bacterium]|jgi:uncharacterized membrane protein YbaN (DUF454 family)
MSSYERTTAAAGPQQRHGLPVEASGPERPLTLTGAVVLAALTAALGVLSAVVIFTQGKSFLRGQLPRGAVYDALVDDAYSTLKGRAIIGLGLAVIVALFTLLARKAALWARIVLTLVLLSYGGLAWREATDTCPGLAKGLDWISVVVGAVAIVLMFLPATSAYRKRLRQG